MGIPTRNQAGYLRETLDSLLAQTRPPDEIVVSDHQSTDETPAVLAEYAARNRGLIRIVEPPSGSNLTAQYNFTLSSQTGDWITLLSSDDLALPNFCASFAQAAEQHPEASLIRAPWQNIDASGNVLSHDYLLSVPRVQHAPATLLSQRFGPKVSFAAFAIRRDAYIASGPILGDLESLADWALFLQLTPFGDFIRTSEIVSGYRVGHEGNRFRARAPLWLRDELRIFSHVMPLAAERLKLRDRRWIQDASRANLRRYLASACRELPMEDRALLVPDLMSWAKSNGEADLAERFARGESIRPQVSLFSFARGLLRPLAHRLAHSVANR
ncbi:MAG TPA: glycosyltransferase family 2 protein [Bryocella sp.]|nr:glycosyltransferase family 2 protein [Bryocella sp.]